MRINLICTLHAINKTTNASTTVMGIPQPSPTNNVILRIDSEDPLVSAAFKEGGRYQIEISSEINPPNILDYQIWTKLIDSSNDKQRLEIFKQANTLRIFINALLERSIEIDNETDATIKAYLIHREWLGDEPSFTDSPYAAGIFPIPTPPGLTTNN